MHVNDDKLSDLLKNKKNKGICVIFSRTHKVRQEKYRILANVFKINDKFSHTYISVRWFIMGRKSENKKRHNYIYSYLDNKYQSTC